MHDTRDKTEKKNRAGKLNISIDNTQINHVSSQKLLELVTDETLSWNPHTDHLCSVISSRISLLKQLSSYVPTYIQKMF